MRGQLRRAAPGIALAVLVIGGAALRIWGLGHQSLWYDESITAREMRLSFRALGTSVRHIETTPPLYFYLAWLWAKAFGTGALALRSLSALAGILTIPVVYACERELAGRRAALAAAALAAANPLLVWYSQEARSYALFLLFASLSLLCALRAGERPTGRRLALWAIAAALTLCTHHFGVFPVAAELGWLALRVRPWQRIAVAGAVVCAVEGVLLPVALSQRAAGANWIGNIQFGLRAREIPELFLAGTSGRLEWLVLAVAGAGLVAALLALARSGLPERRGVLLAGGFALTVVALPMLLAITGQDYVIARNVIPALVGILLALGCGLVALRARVAVPALAAVCSVWLLATAEVHAHASEQRVNWRAAAGLIGPPRVPRATIVSGGYSAEPLLGYRPGMRLFSLRPVRVLELDIVGVPGELRSGCWWGAGCSLIPTRPRLRAPLPGLRLFARSERAGFAIVRWRFARPTAIRLSDPRLRPTRVFRFHASRATLRRTPPNLLILFLADRPR